MEKLIGTLLIGLLAVQAASVKNLHAQGVDTPVVENPAAPAPAEIPLPERKPKQAPKPKIQRTSIPFPSRCKFFKGQTKVSRQQVLKKKADFILVSKTHRRMVLFNGDTPLKAYNVSLGFTPVGHKVQEGDGKTPEGQYFIEFKNWNSQFHRALRVSYPNKRDRARARALGVSPGGNIMIHGEHYDEEKRIAIRDYIAEHGRHDWTHGCIAVRNGEIDEIYAHVDVRSFVEICP